MPHTLQAEAVATLGVVHTVHVQLLLLVLLLVLIETCVLVTRLLTLGAGLVS